VLPYRSNIPAISEFVVFAKSFARIHWQNLINFGVLPLTIAADDYDRLEQGGVIRIESVAAQLRRGDSVRVNGGGHEFDARHQLSGRQIEVVESGGLINAVKKRV
jgi:aconitate hydratase